MTLAAVVHQPRYEIFKTFDDLVLLCPGGKVAYVGPIDKVEEYFTNLGYKFDARENPADVLSGLIISIWLNHNRYLLQQYRSIKTFLLEVTVTAIAGLLIGVSTMGRAGELYAGILISPYALISSAPLEFFLPLFGLLIGISVGLSGAPAGKTQPR